MSQDTKGKRQLSIALGFDITMRGMVICMCCVEFFAKLHIVIT